MPVDLERFLAMEHAPPQSNTAAVFSDLTDEQRLRLWARARDKRYEAGHLFFEPGDQGDRLLIVRAGRVRLYTLAPEGRALTLFVLEPGAFFGEMALVNRPHDCFAEALTDCTIGELHREDLRHVLGDNAAFALRVVDVMSERLRALEQKLADIAFKSVPQRLAGLLLTLAEAQPQPATLAAPPAIMRYTHLQLAEMIGAYRETVTKAIGEFREAGMIRVEDDVIYLTDMQRLRVTAG
jgi:CRP/FNR family cyclic AMP-dependent transcriptional regulator